MKLPRSTQHNALSLEPPRTESLGLQVQGGRLPSRPWDAQRIWRRPTWLTPGIFDFQRRAGPNPSGLTEGTWQHLCCLVRLQALAYEACARTGLQIGAPRAEGSPAANKTWA